MSGGHIGSASEPTRPMRQEFVRALVDHSWARPEAPRPAARLHIVLMVAVFAAAAAVAVGAVLQLMHPARKAKTAAPSPSPPAATAPFAAVSGWGCGGGRGDYGFVAQGRTICAVGVFRPALDQRQDSAATAAQFLVLDGRDGTRQRRQGEA